MLIRLLKKVKNRLHLERERFAINRKLSSARRVSDTKLLDEKCSDGIKVGLHFHVFYTDLIEEIYSHIKNSRHSFTLVLTTTTEENSEFLWNFFEDNPHKNFDVKIKVVENRGRDIYPFYQAFCDDFDEYDVIGHFHTKKSKQNDFGNDWRKFLYDNLLGYDCLFDNVITLFSKNAKVGFITTPPFPVENIRSAYMHFSRDPKVKKDIEIPLKLFAPETVNEMYAGKYNNDFPCGNMFIARKDAVKQFFSTKLTSSHFPDEAGQLMGTLQHYVELMWKYIVEYNGYKYIEILKGKSND